jgi:uncharacterized protein (TIGR02594 family)
MMHPKQKTANALALEAVGMQEINGPMHNPDIVQMFADVGHSWVKDDETAWCAAFVGAMLERAGLPSTRKLNARSYLDWGQPVDLKDAQPGDVVIFSRGDPNGWQGHVGFFVRHAGTHIVVRGGNQSDSVSEARYPVSRLLGVRRYPAPERPSLPNTVAHRPQTQRPTQRPAQEPTGLAGILTRIFKALGLGKDGPA